ncbi:MAG: uroporphyrinogen decarboxylase [Myxococcales bacterium]|nr:MAG: uroporphyrinogen decarboxylase [Myxococcales bacterium]
MSEFLKACRKEPTSFTPIWLMRQAGRYQAEYRAIRSKVSFIELCKNSDLAAEVTLLPVQQFELDAAIVFADILLVLEPLGVGFSFTKEGGPVIEEPLRDSKAIDRLKENIQAEHSLAYVMQTLKKVRQALAGRIPLIGFSGAPFTLASYMIEGGGSRDYLHTKTLMYNDPAAFDVLMQKLSLAVIDYLKAQIKAGAQAVQLFDSWVGCLSPRDYQRFVLPHMKKVFAALGDHVPVIHFSTGNAALYPLMKEAGGHVIGIDWRVDLAEQWERLGDVALQGNLDPTFLLAPADELKGAAKTILDAANSRPGHIFNLGHGVLPPTSPDQVRMLVDYVHEQSAR